MNQFNLSRNLYKKYNCERLLTIGQNHRSDKRCVVKSFDVRQDSFG